MLTKTTIALAVVLFAGSVPVAMAEYDPDPANRYPAYAAPSYVSPVAQAPRGALQSAPVRLRNGGAYSPATNPRTDEINENEWYNTDVHDRASSPFAGGGGM